MDLDSEVFAVDQFEPYLVFTGHPGDESSQIFICCEKEIFITSKSIRDGLIDLMAIYFVFDINFPKHISGILLFFQHFVFNLKDEQPLPTTTSKLVTNLRKVGPTL